MSDASPLSEDLASFLQGLPPGAHVAVDLGGLDLDDAMAIGRRIAQERSEQLVLVGHREQAGAGGAGGAGGDGGDGADARGTRGAPASPGGGPASLARLLEGSARSAPGAAGLVLVDAEASIARDGADSHASAEHRFGRELGPQAIVVCLYTPAALLRLRREDVQRWHSVVAAPGQV